MTTMAQPQTGAPFALPDGLKKEVLNPESLRLGLALSGGGFRATLFHLGVVRFLSEAGLLRQTKVMATVSGGSIIGAHMVRHWDKYLDCANGGFDKVAAEIVKFTQLDVRGWIVRRLPLCVLPGEFCSRTGMLKHKYNKHLFKDEHLGDLRGQGVPEIHIMCTNLSHGRLCSFSQEGFWTDGKEGPRLHRSRLIETALAVTASSSFPAFFPPTEVTPKSLHMALEVLGVERMFLTDGGAYDNLGARKLRQLRKHFDVALFSDAGGTFDWASKRFYGIIGTAVRATDILMNRVQQLEQEINKIDAPGSETVHLRLESVVPDGESPDDSKFPREVVQSAVSKVRTDLDEFSKVEIAALVAHGYCVARQGVQEAYLRRNLPVDHLPAGKPWSPFGQQSPPLDVAAAKRLQRSDLRKVRLFNLNDPCSWIYASMIALVLGAGIWMGAYFNPTAAKHSFRMSIIKLAGHYPKEYRIEIHYDDFETIFSNYHADQKTKEDIRLHLLHNTTPGDDAALAERVKKFRKLQEVAKQSGRGTVLLAEIAPKNRPAKSWSGIIDYYFPNDEISTRIDFSAEWSGDSKADLTCYQWETAIRPANKFPITLDLLPTQELKGAFMMPWEGGQLKIGHWDLVPLQPDAPPTKPQPTDI
jgi:predicted acylesterase/phospholipase RssA